MRYIFLVVMLIGLVGCAGPKPTEVDAAMEIARVQEQAGCLKARYEADAARASAAARLTDPRDIALTTMAQAFGTLATKGQKDPCDMGMGFAESRTIIARSQNETGSAVAKPLITAAGAVAGIWAVGDGNAKVAERTGNKTEVNGDGNNYSNEQVTSHNQQDIKAGDESSITSTAPNVSGPDKHSETTTEMVAPETATPVVKE